MDILSNQQYDDDCEDAEDQPQSTANAGSSEFANIKCSASVNGVPGDIRDAINRLLNKNAKNIGTRRERANLEL
jgi:hypothetical protein